MIIDILLVVGMIVFAFLGFKKGFMRSILSILKGIVSLVIAIIASKPVASVIDNVFGLGKKLGNLFSGTLKELGTTEWFTTAAETAATDSQIGTIKGNDLISNILAMIVRKIMGGAGDSLIGSTPLSHACAVLGFFALIVLTAITIYIIIHILLRFLDKFIQKVTESNNNKFTLDAWLGAAFGVGRYFVNIITCMVFLVVLSSIPFLSGIVDWLFSDSVLCAWCFELTGDLVVWFFHTFDVVGFVVSALGLEV